MPKVSAVMALYDTPFEYLEKTVKSILNQTFSDFELLVIDDCSNVEYLEFFEKIGDERIKYTKLKQNGGPGHARNYGIKIAQGEYIAICDSDDVYYAKRFEKQVEYMDKNQEISVIGAAFKQSNNGKISPVIQNSEDINVNLIFNSQFANPIVMFRKDDFLKNNLFFDENINFAEDYKLWLDAMFAGLKMANLPDVLMTYTRRNGQLSKEKKDIQTEILCEIYSGTLEKLKISTDFKDTIYNIYNQDFKQITNDDIKNIFIALKNTNFFNKSALEKKEYETFQKYEKIKNRLFKIKLGNKNFCISKNLKIYLEKRE